MTKKCSFALLFPVCLQAISIHRESIKVIHKNQQNGNVYRLPQYRIQRKKMLVADYKMAIMDIDSFKVKLNYKTADMHANELKI